MQEKLLDPTGASEREVDTTLAPRLRSLRGLRVGLLDNAKPNASVLLAQTGRELQRAHGVQEIRMYQKGYFGTPVEESLIQKILHNCDFVVAGIGD
jgi:predicted component of type VI protein secretion system